MTSTSSVWQGLPPVTLVGIFLGILGVLYLAYDFVGRRSELLNRCAFIFSAGFLFVGVQLMSYLFLIAPRRLADGNPSLVQYAVFIFSVVGLMMLSVFSSALPQSRPSGVSGINWLNAIGSMALSSVGLVGLGAVAAPGSSPIVAVLFASPGILAMGLLNGFSPAIQWWMIHLPEKRVAVVGSLLILCAFALIFVQPLLDFKGISF